MEDTALPVPTQNPAPDATRHGRSYTAQDVLDVTLSSLNDDKGEDIVQIDLKNKSEIADHMVIVSGRSSRQVSSIADKLAERLKAEFGIFSKIEGQDTGDWVLLDSSDVIVHIFRPEVREFYQLEKMWLHGIAEHDMPPLEPASRAL